MAEVDYQMALLLQYKFEQEHKRKEDTDSDHRLALELQEQFKSEVEVERPNSNLVYKAPAALNNSKCLVDPSWEVIDPTPDVHVLFTAFNQKFFWNSLGSVTVAWSKRMTSCAGICAYQGRGGMCSITLSEPLLKLRPRKDLVETLLHEMIHAYLFVTNNNRDRDGHGPEFHKHMYRINAEAGTNITVYHDFHDEVRLYQQHWWRCNGPCQNLKPYFGMVRRATNRIPGPNDRWWDEHMRNCGGTFIKVKSPEKPVKEPKTLGKKNAAPPKETSSKNDIRNYITSTSNKPITPEIPNKTVKPKVSTNSKPNNIHTVSNKTPSTPQISNVIPSKTSNIFGFKNLGGGSNNSPNRPGVKGAVKNAGSSTFVVTKKGSKTTTSVADTDNIAKASTSTSDNIKPFSGSGRSLSSGSVSSLDNEDYSVVRNHWLKRFDNNKSLLGTKRPCGSPTPCSQKLPKLTPCDSEDKNKVECPICKKKFQLEELNDHLDTCLEGPKDNSKECIICGLKVSIVNFDRHITDCSARNFSDVFEDEEEPLDLTSPNQTDSIDLTSPSRRNDEETKNCPVCKEQLSPQDYNIHVQNCILGMCDEFDKKCDSMPIPIIAKTPCLACGKEILKADLDSHLEDCMSMSNVFDTTNVPIEDIDDDLDDKHEEGHKDYYNCPFCLELVLENEMQVHLNGCLDADEVVGEDNVKEKKYVD